MRKNATKKRNQKRNQKVANKGVGVEDLTSAQAEIYTYFNAGLSVAQIAAKRGCSPQYVRKVRKKLRGFGLLSKQSEHVVASGGVHPATSATKNATKRNHSSSPSDGVVRVHAQRFSFDIVHFGSRFKPGLAQHLDDGTWVQCYDKSLVVYAAKNCEFHGADLESALQSSFDFWLPVFRKVENDFDVKIIKPRKAFRVVYTEVAAEGSVVAGAVIAKEGSIRIASDDDGKLRLSFDLSKNVPEWEVHHARSWHSDKSSADHHFNAILEYGSKGATLPQLAQLHAELAETLRSQMELTSAVVQSLQRPYLPDDGKNKRVVDYFG